uniref:Uncharacterized protein n=1 Tax=Nothobranchius furzeri TaxID=105023 RepID=A0A8C6Q0A1_NOTFU
MDAGNSFPILNDDLEPGKAGVCPGSDGHISQIPGLSPTIRSLPEEKARGRRVGVQESDSDYVKLAKQGGHKGLLWHDGTITSKLTSYKTPDWFSNESGDSNKQRCYTQQPLKPPFWTENVTARERGDGCSNKDKEVKKKKGNYLSEISDEPAAALVSFQVKVEEFLLDDVVVFLQVMAHFHRDLNLSTKTLL